MRNRRIFRGEEKLEADGETHRRDCGCPRCEAGFAPTEKDREVAGRRTAARRGREVAARAWARKKEAARLKQQDLAAYFEGAHAVVEAEVRRLRALRAKVIEDRRAEELLALRRAGMSLGEALAEVERRFPTAERSQRPPENDNSRAEGEGVGAGGDGCLLS